MSFFKIKKNENEANNSLCFQLEKMLPEDYSPIEVWESELRRYLNSSFSNLSGVQRLDDLESKLSNREPDESLFHSDHFLREISKDLQRSSKTSNHLNLFIFYLFMKLKFHVIESGSERLSSWTSRKLLFLRNTFAESIGAICIPTVRQLMRKLFSVKASNCLRRPQWALFLALYNSYFMALAFVIFLCLFSILEGCSSHFSFRCASSDGPYSSSSETAKFEVQTPDARLQDESCSNWYRKVCRDLASQHSLKTITLFKLC